MSKYKIILIRDYDLSIAELNYIDEISINNKKEIIYAYRYELVGNRKEKVTMPIILKNYFVIKIYFDDELIIECMGKEILHMGQDSKLKKLLTALKEDALKLQLESYKESVEASAVASRYLQAIDEIDAICKTRNRY